MIYKNALIVDDDSVGLLMYKYMLERKGFNVWLAHSFDSGAEVLHERGASGLDVVISDKSYEGGEHFHPTGGGVAFVQFVHFVRPQIPVVMITGDALPSSQIREINPHLEHVPILKKPVSYKLFTRVVEATCKMQRGTGEEFLRRGSEVNKRGDRAIGLIPV